MVAFDVVLELLKFPEGAEGAPAQEQRVGGVYFWHCGRVDMGKGVLGLVGYLLLRVHFRLDIRSLLDHLLDEVTAITLVRVRLVEIAHYLLPFVIVGHVHVEGQLLLRGVCPPTLLAPYEGCYQQLFAHV